MSSAAAPQTLQQQQAKQRELQKELQTLRVAQQEIATIKPGRHVYESRGGIWFLSSAHDAGEHLKAKLHKTETKITAANKQTTPPLTKANR